MPKITGLEFFKSLKNAPQVIFTTAYPQYALEGFDVAALDYLVKPISLERFFKAALKAKEYYEVRLPNNLPHADVNKSSDYFFIKADGKMIKIFYKDILFIEAIQNYVNIYTTQNKHITYLTLLSVEAYLPADLFIKTHKSYIISSAKVDSMEGNEIVIGTYRIPVSRNLKEDVTEKLIGKRFLKR
jgi:DNA-binding LytR/AlgR family response regulator